MDIIVYVLKDDKKLKELLKQDEVLKSKKKKLNPKYIIKIVNDGKVLACENIIFIPSCLMPGSTCQAGTVNICNIL